jgi:hypothetical protein
MERLLFDLLLILEAEECTIESYEGDTMELTIESAALTREQLRDLETRLDRRLDDIDFGPRNMSRIQVHLKLVFLPGPAATGT